MNIPIISLQVEGMKHTVKTALLRHAAEMDSAIQKAVDDYCTEDNINRVVRSTAMDALNQAVKQEVQDFFRYSNAGRVAVRGAVMEYLNEMYPSDAARKEET